MQSSLSDSVSAGLDRDIGQAIADAGGWLPFDRFMALALYAPGRGYYARGDRQFGAMPQSGSDFVTAPELTPRFGRTLARQVAQALDACGVAEVVEFGAGSGALASQLIDALGDRLQRYSIVDVSAVLRERQQQTLAPFGDRVQWLDALPQAFAGVVVANEVLDAMPVRLLHFDGRRWHERGVVVAGGCLAWRDRPTDLVPPEPGPFVAGTVTEVNLQAQAFVRTLADRLQRGAAFFIDYGFPAAEYYLPQRVGGTLMCHRAHRVDSDPLVDVGLKDITAHVDFSAIALTAQEAGFEVLGYTSQANFLINCGVLDGLEAADPREIAAVQRLIQEHEMGELFKVLALARGCRFDPIGFVRGDRTHRL